MEIDELVGEKLAAAVMVARGGIQAQGYREGSVFWLDGELQTIVSDDMVRRHLRMGSTTEEAHRPDLYIAQAWELDGEGWFWSFREIGLGEYKRVRANVGAAEVNEDGTRDRFSASAYFRDFPTKAGAYATARCRAFLKAKAAQ